MTGQEKNLWGVGREIKKLRRQSQKVQYTCTAMYLPNPMSAVRNDVWKISRTLLKILIQEANGIGDNANEMKCTSTFSK